MVDYSHVEPTKIENVDHPLMLLGIKLNYLLVTFGCFLISMTFIGIVGGTLILLMAYFASRHISKSESRGRPLYFDTRVLTFIYMVNQRVHLDYLSALVAIKRAQKRYR